MGGITTPAVSNSLVPVRNSSTGGGPSMGDVALVRLPPRIQVLTHPFVITGKVSGHNPDGTISLSTRFGEIVLRTNATMADKVAITLHIAAGKPPRRAQAFAGVHPELSHPEGVLAASGGRAAAAGSAPGGPDQTLAASGGATLERGHEARDTPPELVLDINPDARGQHQSANGETTEDEDADSIGGLRPGTRIIARFRGDWAPASGLPAVIGPAVIGPAVIDPAVIDQDGLRDDGRGGERDGWEKNRIDAAGPRLHALPPRERTPLLVLRLLTITLPTADSSAEGPNPGTSGALDAGPDPRANTGPDAGGTRDAGQGPLGARLWAARVVGTSHDRHPIVLAEDGAWELQRRGFLPVGTRVTALVLERNGEKTEAEVSSTRPPGAGALQKAGGRGGAWPTLRQAIAALSLVDRGAAAALTDSTLPAPDERLAAALLFFMSSARAGDAREWLGEDATQALERSGQTDLLAELGEEFRALAGEIAETPADQWQSYPIPLLDGNRLLDLHVHVRHPEDDGSNGGRDDTERPCRFLVDVAFSRIGPLQIDGLIKAERFHMIVRTQHPLDPALRHELQVTFSDCLEAAGYAGGMTFQDGGRGWLSPDRASPAAPRRRHPVIA